MASRLSFKTSRMRSIVKLKPIAKIHTSTADSESLPLDIPIDEERGPGYDYKQFYHASPGEILAQRFKLVAKVGYGSTSTVWLAHTTSRILKKRYVAIKIRSCDHHGREDAQHETDISDIIRKHASCEDDLLHVSIIDESFEIQGPHGKHVCLVMEPLRDPLWLIRSRLEGESKARHENIRWYKIWLKATLAGLDYLHSKCQLIHTDLKLDNIMLGFEATQVIKDFVDAQNKHPMARKIYSDHTVYSAHNDFGTPREIDGIASVLLMIPKITDFGIAMKGTNHPLVHPIQPDFCKSPEVILGLTWTYSADIWNFAVMVYELLEGRPLFSHTTDASGVYSAKHHLAEMTKLLGPLPQEMLDKVLKLGQGWKWAPPIKNPHGKPSSTSNEYFGGPFYNEDGHLIHAHLDPPLPNHKSWKSVTPHCIIADDEANYVDFMQKMLCWSPDKRSTAKELFEHPWLEVVL